MSQFLLVLAVGLTVGTVIFGVTVAITSREGLRPAEPDGKVVPLPIDRPLVEPDLAQLRFDVGLRGYRMDQVDAALQRVAYDIGYKDELIKVLEAEVAALREGRGPEAENLRRTREAALAAAAGAPGAGLPDRLTAPEPRSEPASKSDEPAGQPEPEPQPKSGSGSEAASGGESDPQPEPASEPESGSQTEPTASEPTPSSAQSGPPAEAEVHDGPIAAEAGAPAPRADEPTPAVEDSVDRR